jgi:hypothetical protein
VYQYSCKLSSKVNSKVSTLRGSLCTSADDRYFLLSSQKMVTTAASPPAYASAYVSIRQHTSAYASIRQHTSAYVSILVVVAKRQPLLAAQRLLRQYLYCCTSKAVN